MKEIRIYTDGACSGNPGKGGWGAILIYGETEKKINGFLAQTTNNQMELLAAIEALKSLKEPCKVDLYTDSKYVQNGITSWVNNWMNNNWMNANKKPVKNVDLWKRLMEEEKQHFVTWHWVKGHAGNKYNEIADELARKAIEDSDE